MPVGAWVAIVVMANVFMVNVVMANGANPFCSQWVGACKSSWCVNRTLAVPYLLDRTIAVPYLLDRTLAVPYLLDRTLAVP